ETIEQERAQAKDEGIKEQVKLEESTVATPSSGAEAPPGKVADLSREEVYEAVDYTPE
ncbi:hypothetical protein LCGC14_3127670, partial [marine sediment metagenome]